MNGIPRCVKGQLLHESAGKAVQWQGRDHANTLRPHLHEPEHISCQPTRYNKPFRKGLVALGVKQRLNDASPFVQSCRKGDIIAEKKQVPASLEGYQTVRQVLIVAVGLYQGDPFLQDV